MLTFFRASAANSASTLPISSPLTANGMIFTVAAIWPLCTGANSGSVAKVMPGSKPVQPVDAQPVHDEKPVRLGIEIDAACRGGCAFNVFAADGFRKPRRRLVLAQIARHQAARR